MPPIAEATTSLDVVRVEPVARGLCAAHVDVGEEAAGRALREGAARPRRSARRPSRSRSAVRSIVWMSSPKTWMPSGLRMPVASISVRVWIGIHQTLGMPGYWSFSSISRDEAVPGQPRAPLVPRLQEYRRSRPWTAAPGRSPSRRGPSCRRRARPRGTREAARPSSCRTRLASVTDIPGGAVGMYRITPSLSGGMNSLPKPEEDRDRDHRSCRARGPRPATGAGPRSARRARRSQTSHRLSGFASSLRSLPRISSAASAGVSVTARIAAKPIE